MIRRAACALILWLASIGAVSAYSLDSSLCRGKFFNPVTDICWSCEFPMKIAGKTIMNKPPGSAAGPQDEPSNASEGNSVCTCTTGSRAIVGLNTGFWEAARLVEVVRQPYCFVSLGGVVVNAGSGAPGHHQKKKLDSAPDEIFYQMHYYYNSMHFWLESVLDTNCLDRAAFDVAYMTELDPGWDDSELLFLTNPDVALYANPVAKLACAADCLASNLGWPLNALYWCAGCQGSLFPLNGQLQSYTGGVMASTLMVQRLVAKMHRELLIESGSGQQGLCGYYRKYLMDKNDYKMQMVYPIANTTHLSGKCCQPFGRSTVLWGAGKEYPWGGEDFSYQLFRKRNCCTGYAVN